MKKRNRTTEEHTEKIIAHPMSSLDFVEMLDRWNDSFNDSISNPTAQWQLVKYSIMPGEQTSQLLVVYIQPNYIGEPDCKYLYKYRALLYDMMVSPVLVNSSEFQFKEWKLFTAWVYKGKLYAVMEDDDKNFDVVRISGDGNESILNLGKYVLDAKMNFNGDILVGYDCCEDKEEERSPVWLFKNGADNKELESDDAISCEAVSVDSKNNIWAYVKPYRYVSHMEGDKYETFDVPITGFSGLGVSDDNKTMLVSMNYSNHGARLYALKKIEDEFFGDEVKVVLDTGEEELRENVNSAEFAGDKAVIHKGRYLYMVNINELEWSSNSTQ